MTPSMMTRAACLCLVLLGVACVPPRTPELVLPATAKWQQTSALTFKGKQDDVFFVDPKVGLYVNGAGEVFRTDDGGATWTRTLSKPGTYWRALGMLDAQHGFLGNIGTEYFPGVTDETPLYRTDDGGKTVTPVDLGSTPVKGLCAIDVLKLKFINAGQPEDRVVVHAAGRVGGPAWLVRSLDGGATWKVLDLSAQLAMITDVKFLSESVGFVVGGTNSAMEQSHAVILSTRDGGATWTRAYESKRELELIWKVAFASSEVGYATVMHYDANRAQQVVAKTEDGGRTWVELPLTSNAAAREFGVGFASPSIGWVGTGAGGFQTVDGGRTWTSVDLGRYANKVRVLHVGTGVFAAAVGTNVFVLDVPGP